jgi:putative hemolysin
MSGSNAKEPIILFELLVILGLVALNGILSGAEIAVVTVRRTRIEELVEEKSRAAKAVKRLRDNPERFLATVQIGITVVGAAAGAFGGASFARDLSPAVARVPWLGLYANDVALALVVVVISSLSIVFGELVPKSLALRYAETYALAIGRPLLGLSWLARPVIWMFSAASNAVLKVFGDRTNFIETKVSPEELQQMVEQAAQSGSVHPEAGEIASRAIDFSKLTAERVMIPRGRVVAIPRHAPTEDVRRILLEHGHSRVPIYETSLDNVIGYISIKDIIALGWEGRLIVLDDLIRTAYFVPETMLAVDLLKEMRTRHMPLAIVVDDQGGMAGIVTIEDLLEELVGEIFNEYSGGESDTIHSEPDGSAVVRGDLPIRDVNRELSLDLEERDGYSTIAGLCLALAGRVPKEGEWFAASDGTVLTVLRASERRIEAVRLQRAPTPSEA